MQDSSPRAYLYSSCNALSLEILRELLALGCKATVVSDDPRWGENHQSVVIETGPDDIKANYVLCLENDGQKIQASLMFANQTNAKFLLIKSYVAQGKPEYSSENFVTTYPNLNIGVLCIGSPVTGDEALSHRFAFVKTIINLNADGQVELAESTEFFPITISELSKEIVKKLLTMSAFGKITAILGSKISLDEFIKIVNSVNSTFKISTSTNTHFFCETVDQKEYIFQNQKDNLKSLLKTPELVADKKPDVKISKLVIPKHFSQSPKTVDTKTSSSSRNKRYVWAAIVGLFTFVILIVFLPIALLLLNYSILMNAKTDLISGNIQEAKTQLVTAKKLSDFSGTTMFAYSKIPLVSSATESFDNVSNVFGGMSNAGLTFIEILNTSLLLMDKSTEEKVYDLQGLSDKLVLDIDSLNREIGFVTSEIEDLPKLYYEYLNNVVSSDDLSSISNKLNDARKITDDLPKLFGSDKPVNYLVLFQNDLRPRATGGVINSYAIVTLSGGRVVDVAVSSVGSSDKFFAGSIDPPAPFKDYLNYDNWLLRDSNWNIEYSESAKQAAWFVEKEIDVIPTGVISVDTYFVNEFFKIFGEGDSDLRGKIEGIMEGNNTSGEYPEEEFMSESLVKFFDLLFNLDNSNNLSALSFAKDMIAQRRLMVTHSQKEISQALSNFGIDGSIKQNACGENCFSDLVGYVESDFSGGNTKIERGANLEVSLEEGLVKRKLSITFTNGDTQNGYDAYVRFVGVGNSGFSKAKSIGVNTKEVEMDIVGNELYKEAGLLVSLLPGETKTIEASWESGASLDFENGGEYKQLFLVQPGLSVPVDMTVKLPRGLEFSHNDFGTSKDGVFILENVNAPGDIRVNLLFEKI